MAGLGDTLRQTRDSHGTSLEEAERATHIARRYLVALEAEEFGAFPAPVFARGFLRNYAQYLGLDPQEVLALWPEGGEAPVPEPAPETARDEFERRAAPMRDRTAPRRPPTVRRGGAPSPLSRHVQTRTEPTPVSWVLGLVAGTVAFVALLAFVVSILSGGSSAAAPPSRASGSTGAGNLPAGNLAAARATQAPAARNVGKMPSLVGTDATAAIQQLQSTGVTPLVVSVAPSGGSAKPNTVVKQDPSPGTAINTNSSVALSVNGATAPQAPAATAVPALPTGTSRGR